MKIKVSLFWFRRDLRLDDNNGLFQALSGEYPVLPLFIFDTEILNSLSDKADKRVNFIYREVSCLKKEIESKGCSLLVKYGNPVEIFKELLLEYDIKRVFANRDYESYSKKRDSQIESIMRENGVEFSLYKDVVIFDNLEVTKKDGTPYTVYTPYSKVWKEKLSSMGTGYFNSVSLLHRFLKVEKFKMPTIEAVGFLKTQIDFPSAIINEAVISEYDKNRDFPYLDGTSRIGIHLRFGTISIRNLVNYAVRLNQIWLNELIWREFFFMILSNFPYVETRSFKPAYDFIEWRNDPDDFEKWCNGETGFPIVDAGMRELNQTGYMHNRARMIVASFLTKDLLIDWRMGEAYFAEKLLDYELASNNGNWQWAAGCGCDAQPWFRIFNPSEQQKKFDKDKLYIEKWLKISNGEYKITPITDHTIARERAVIAYKSALSARG